jgi:hypothetical protein
VDAQCVNNHAESIEHDLVLQEEDAEGAVMEAALAMLRCLTSGEDAHPMQIVLHEVPGPMR